MMYYCSLSFSVASTRCLRLVFSKDLNAIYLIRGNIFGNEDVLPTFVFLKIFECHKFVHRHTLSEAHFDYR